jgi:hypothetical protein
MESTLFCHSGTLKGLDGQPVEFTDCSTLRFVLNKKTKYTYTAEWSDGTVTSDDFTTGGGGSVTVICPSTGSGSTGGSCSNKANTFKIGSTTFSAQFTECDVDGGYYLYAESSNESEVEILLPSKPVNNGTYKVVNADTFGNLQPGQAALYAYSESSDRDYYSTGGGTFTVTLVNGKVQVDFCKVPVKDYDSSTTTTIGGKLTCQ